MNKPSPTFSSSPAVSGDRCQRDFSQWPCFLMLLAALVLCLIPACSRQSETVTVLARVGERAITAEDLQKEVERRRQIRRPVPAKDILLQEMVAYESMLQRALSSGLDKDPKVQRDLNNLLIAKLKEKELMPLLDAVEVSEEEIAAAYEKQIDQYQRSSKVRLALLQLKANPKTNDAAREEMRKQLEMARHKFMENPPRGGRGPASGGFGALAIEYSEDQVSRYRGGDIGWLDADRFTYHWPRTVLETGYALEKGQVSPVIETDQGYFLIMKTDHRDSATTPYQQVKSSLRQSLVSARQEEVEERFRSQLLDMAKTELFPEALESVTLPQVDPTTVAQNQDLRPPLMPGSTPISNGQ